MICKFSTIEEVKEYFENIIAVMPLHVYWKDIQGVILGCNNQQAVSAGMTREQMIGKTDYQMPWKTQADEIRRSDNYVMRSGEKLVIEEKSTLRNGKQATFLSTKLPLYDSKRHSIVGVIGISVDITDRKRMEASLKKEKEKSEEFNQLKSQFISNMQHDLRSPAAGVMQALSYLHDIEKEPKKLEILNLALGSSKALMLLLNEIVDSENTNYSHPIMKEPLKLSAIFESVYRLNAAGAAIKHLKFHYHVDEHIPRVILSDKYRLERVLLNLVGNAVKFTQEGEVFFEAKLAKQNGRELLIEFIVKDTGIGIPENKKRIIFERFVRLDPSNRGQYKGLGLGLTNVREYVRDLEGEFRPIISAQGLGTTFSILIPMKASLDQELEMPSIKRSTNVTQPENLSIKEKAIPVKTSSLKSPATEQSNGGDLLLVEDSLPAQFMTRSLMKNMGCELDIAGTAEDALEMIQQKTYDLIFADIGLPGMDGIEMTRHIRYEERKKGGKRIPIVGQSANASTANRKACIEAGMQDLLAKPLTIQSVKEVLQNYAESYALSQPSEPFLLPQIKKTTVIDQEALMRIWKNTESFKDAFEETKLSTLKDIEHFKAAYHDKNWKRLLFLTHKLRGGFVYLAASRVEEAFSYLEDYLSLNKNKTKKINEKPIKHMYNLIIIELDKALDEIKLL